ncbi:MAG TPA: 5'/3'-nucleotidase SurE [Armatimonadota bacterium]|nr:5'/3'-nucleotidase SurE [Armatimonadota bacterium]
MANDRPQILLTNDDGIYAEGISVLRDALAEVADVTVVAPERPRSATGHAITLHKPLRVDKVRIPWGGRGYATNGTPSDCVVLGIFAIMERCDCVISGINLGPNLGEDITYSGTVSAAMEGAICGKPSIAVSLADYENPDFHPSAKFIVKLVRHVLQHGLPDEVILNVNIPNLPESELGSPVITQQGKRRYEGRVEKRIDPRGRPYYWLGGEIIEDTNGAGTDGDAIMAGKISITPLHLNLTDRHFAETLREWNLS